MSSRRIRWGAGLAALALVASAMLIASVSQARQQAPAAAGDPPGGPPPGAPLDHFVCYHVLSSQNQTASGTVKLADEFTVNPTTNQQVLKPVHVGLPVKLCAPITKMHAIGSDMFYYPMVHPTLHLVCFKINEPTPTPPRTVSTDNQFNPSGQKRILTTQTLSATSKQTATSACLPSHKSLGAAPPQGEPLNLLSHFKCYKAAETEPSGQTVPGLPAGAWALDQFSPTPIPKYTVVAPVEVCNPAEKTVSTAAGTQDYPAVNPDLHLVCFSIRGGINLNGKQVFVDDQFTSAPAGSFGQLTLGAAYQLCAPSFKQIIPPPPS